MSGVSGELDGSNELAWRKMQTAAHWLWHEGISAARLRGVHKGRPASIAAAKVAALKAEGLGATEIAKRLKVGRASVYRLLAS